jgi:putative intracellular protease/amidase
MAEKYLEKGIVVGAICGATIGLAMGGVLDQRAHTSNDLGYLKMVCPSYDGEKYYKQECVVTDGNLITASGIAPLEFTLHILKILEVFLPQTLDSWYNLYKTQEAKYFFELMNSIQ